ncbi:MAG: CDP-alcohol phosphatidyltransferase family protein [Rhizomicrobium sp.]
MLDSLLRRHLDGPLAPAAAWLSARKVRGWTLTVSAFLCSAVAMLDIGHRDYLLGLALLALAGAFDSLDGPVARREGATPFGAYLDLVLSVIAAAGIAFAFALAAPDRALAAMFLMLGLVARTAALAGTLAAAPWAPVLIGKTELFVAFALACLLPDWFSIIAYLVGTLCFVAAGSRVAAVAAQQP